MTLDTIPNFHKNIDGLGEVWFWFNYAEQWVVIFTSSKSVRDTRFPRHMGAEAVALYNKFQPDVLLSDVARWWPSNKQQREWT